MPACVPINNNNVGDSNMAPPSSSSAGSDSKFSKIISCLFLKKKTDVVDMTKKDTPAAAKKKKLTVDRSERSRRVLKMESMRAVPQSRDGPETSKPPSPGQNQMFLPSENPTASFLSYLDPSARRACADVIRSNSTASHARPVREAFADGKIHTRNTNYRGQQISENGRPGKVGRKGSTGNSSRENDSDTPPALPPRSNRRRPVVVPGIMATSDDDMGYNSDGDISDLHDEMRRMNMNGHSRQNGHDVQRHREGSISLSEGSEQDEEILAVSERPTNPSPGGAVDTSSGASKNTKKGGQPKKTMEAVIDDLFQQTQNNIDTIYRNGLETMVDIDESNRPETATPETCMRRLEADLAQSQPDEESTEEDTKPPETPSKLQKSDSRKSQHQKTHTYQAKPDDSPNLDNLLTEVSIWAKDRQNWLLDGGNDPKTEALSRDSTVVSMTTDGRVIAAVNKTNKDKCNEWVTDNSKPLNYSKSEPRTNGILTGPKLFRSSSKSPSGRSVSFKNDKNGDNVTQVISKQPSNMPETRKVKLPTKKHFGGVQIVDLGQDNDSDIKEVPGLDILGPYPEPWTADMYASSTPVGDRHERSTINDDVSEPERRRTLRGRSPESWLSSNGSCSNLLSRTNTTNKDDDSFEFSTTPVTTPRSRNRDRTIRISASNVAKSHQIVRQTPKIHTPFSQSIERQLVSRQKEAYAIPIKPMLRNTQLKPLAVLRSAAKPANPMDSYPALPGMKNFMYEESGQGFKNVHQETASQSPRPFSEIPLRPDLRNNDRNSSMLAHSSSLRDDMEQYSVPDAVTRPVSETLPPKRSDKIGTGPIMTTKSKQTYARDVINAMERQRFKNNQEAFKENNNVENTNESSVENLNTSNEKREPENAKKRHKVFTNSLIRGGYSYDKHSRKHTTGDNQFSEVGTINQNDTVTTSINDLALSVRDSTEQNAWPIMKPKLSPRTMQGIIDTEVTGSEPPSDHSTNSVKRNNRGNTQSKSFNIKATSNTDINRGVVSTSFHNKYSVVQSHGLGGTQNMDPPNADKTAFKFRQLRNRRDQEMEWLMRDAAETEV